VNAVAIVVGINDYRDQPLTSAVPDALAFRDALIDLGLVDQASVTLLTAPARAGSLLATRDEITAALREPYRNGDDLDRLYVFFSGHGMLVQSNASHSTSATAFLPADVTDPVNESWKLLNLDELLRSFRSAGPREQFFFFDACRNLRYDQYPPDLPPVGLGGRNQPPVGVRAQSVLYAVSPGGQALGTVGGLGVLTSHLVQALQGAGEALDFDDELDSYVVTSQSVFSYVRARIGEQLKDVAHWQREYMLPDEAISGPSLTPIRLVPDPGPGRLTLTVDPPGDADYVKVSVLQRGARLAEPRWPPAPFGTPVQVPRQRFRLSAGSYHGATGVEPELIDGRTMTTALIRHKYIGPLGPGPKLPADPVSSPADPGPGPAAVTYSDTSPVTTRGGIFETGPGGLPGWLEAAVAEPWATIDVAGLDPPYRSQSVQASRDEAPELVLPPGSYQVRFRVGSEQFSETTAEIEQGRTTTVQASAFASPLVAAVTGQTEHQAMVELSEHFGPVQANPALALATLIALGRAQNTLAMLYLPEPLPTLRGPSPDRWLSLAVAVDGSGWTPSAAEVAAGLETEIMTPRSYHGDLSRLSPMGLAAGLDQIVGTEALLPWPSCRLALRSTSIGEIELMVASARRMVTSVGIVLRDDGGIDVVQLLTPPHLDEDGIGQHVRRSLLGQWLYRSGELISHGSQPAQEDLADIVTGYEADPLLSPMAYHALSRMLADGTAEQLGFGRGDLERIGRRLISEFPDQVDTAVIAADLGGDRDRATELLASDQLPILADSLRLAGTWTGGLPPAAAAMAAGVQPGSLWTMRWTQPRAGGA
jgi:hypothetical protein